MASVMDPHAPAPMNFPGPIGAKRRRMRSGGNVSTQSNNTPSTVENISEEKTTQTSKCKGATTIPIFLKKTYKMIDTCDPNIASWTPDGEMFIVKDPDVFATQVIPQYFDHNKFSSFARQLNFYGFRKMQSKPIRNSDYDANSAKHVTFFNENFKRGRCDLLKMIQRSTRGGGTAPGQDQQKEMKSLRDQVTALELKCGEMEEHFEERLRRLEMEMLARMEQVMITVQQQQQTQLQLQKAASVGSVTASTIASSMPAPSNWESNNHAFTRGNSLSSAVNGMGSVMFQQPMQSKMDAPTLPPHPKQKLAAPSFLPGSVAAPPERFSSLLSRGISGLSRGASIESTASALLRNTWEDKFFSLLMLDGNDPNAMGAAHDASHITPTPIGTNGSNMQVQRMPAPVAVSNRSMDDLRNGSHNNHDEDHEDLSSVSSSDMP